MSVNLYNMDENLSTMMAEFELEGERCHLKHGCNPDQNPPAVDYLCQRLGDQKTVIATQEIRVPICKECVDALVDSDWILVYCTYCHQSQWIYRPKAKIKHPKGNGIYWLDVCPHCAEIVTEYKGE